MEVVGECADGAEALAALRAQPCDLVFLDVEMPGLSGLEVARRLGPDRLPAVVFVTQIGLALLAPAAPDVPDAGATCKAQRPS